MNKLYEDTKFRLIIALSSIGIILFIWFVYHIITYREFQYVTVYSVEWDTKIDRYQWQTIRDEDWSIPYGGREIDRRWREKTSYQVKTGVKESCTGTGRDRTCTYTDVYKTYYTYDWWYTYDLDQWVRIQPLTARGNTHDWHMPDVTDKTWYIENTTPVIGDMRQGTYFTHFYVVFQGDKKQYSADMTEIMWRTFNVGDSYYLTLNWIGNILTIEKG